MPVNGKDKHSKKLVFQPPWLEMCKWLVYSSSQWEVFGKYCVMHDNPIGSSSTEKKTLVTAPFQKLEKPSSKDGALKHHHKMQCHQRALDTGVALVQSA